MGIQVENRFWLWSWTLLLQVKAMDPARPTLKPCYTTFYVGQTTSFFYFIKMRIRIPTSQSCHEDEMAWRIYHVPRLLWLLNKFLLWDVILLVFSSFICIFSLMKIYTLFYDNGTHFPPFLESSLLQAWTRQSDWDCALYPTLAPKDDMCQTYMSNELSYIQLWSKPDHSDSFPGNMRTETGWMYLSKRRLAH